MLANSVLQSLRCAAYVPTITVPQKIMLKSDAGNTPFLLQEEDVKIACCSTAKKRYMHLFYCKAKKHFSTLALILFSSPTKGVPNQGR